MAKNFACLKVTASMVEEINNTPDATLFRLIPSPEEEKLECPIFDLKDAYYREVVALDQGVEAYIRKFPGGHVNGQMD
jgi:hypothetical protein